MSCLAAVPKPTITDEVLDTFLAGSTKYTANDIRELLTKQTTKIRELKEELAEAKLLLCRAETECRQLRERLSREGLTAIEVLRRMYQGVDAFDQARFKCAVEALEFESPRLIRKEVEKHSTSYAVMLQAAQGIAQDEERERRQKQLNLRVYDGGSGGIAAPTSPDQCEAKVGDGE